MTRCFCDAECLAKGGVGANGQPKGVQMLEVEKKMHLRRIERESLERASEDLLISTITNDRIPSLRTPNSSARAAPNYHAPEASQSSTSTHKETSNNDMPPLMESSDDEEEETPVLLADRRRDRNKITKRDKQILENINKKITTCANNLTHSRPVLQATRETIREVCVALKGIRSHETGIAALKSNAIQSLDNLEARWTELSSLLADDQPLEYSTTHHFASTMHHYSIIIQIAIFLGVFVAGVIDASRNDGDFIMGILNILLFQAVQPLDGGLLDSRHEDLISQMPNNIRAALSKFDLDNKTVIYAVCPRCHCTYAPYISPGETAAKYPSHCTNHTDPSSNQCGQPLLRRDGTGKEDSWKPIKPFVYHSFHDYLAGLLSRKDLEEAMDKACDELQGLIDGPLPSFASDVWQAEFLRSFQGPTPGRFVVDRGNEGRYVFSLNFDTFNVEGMRIRGASAACGLISMVCLNLPPHLRYKPEYMYIAGIIPGPKQPTETELNHYFRPLIDDMEQSWKLGVRYTMTASFPEGHIM